ncbi:MAG: hypothetical protein N2422_07500 [Rhodobacteraceae bacterium]|nr:hypothetical protein [Paracoccaceae bacterium]
MKAIAEYFRDLAANDRYFGATPPTPDAEMLQRLAEREVQRRVEARIAEQGIVLRQTADGAFHAAPAAAAAEAAPAPAPAVAASAVAPAAALAEAEAASASPVAEVVEPAAPAMPPVDDESVAMKLARIRSAVAATSAVADAAPAFGAGDEVEAPAVAQSAAGDDFGYAVDTGAPMPAEAAGAAAVPEAAVPEAVPEASAEGEMEGELSAEPAADLESMLRGATPAAAFAAGSEGWDGAADEAAEEAPPQAAEAAVIAGVLAASADDAGEAAGEAAGAAAAGSGEDLEAALAAAFAAADAGEEDEADAQGPAGTDDSLAAAFAAGSEGGDFADAGVDADEEPAVATGEEHWDMASLTAAAADEAATAEGAAVDAAAAEGAGPAPDVAIAAAAVAAGDATLSRRERRLRAAEAAAAAAEAVAEAEARDHADQAEHLAGVQAEPEAAGAQPEPEAAGAQPEPAEPVAEAPARAGIRVIKVRRGGQIAAGQAAAEAPAVPPGVLVLQPADRVDAGRPADAAAAGHAGDGDDEEAIDLSVLHAAAEQADAAIEIGEDQPEGRAILEGEATDSGAVERLMEEANTKLEGAENRRRFSAIAHLKAAVAATVADRKLKGRDLAAPPAAPSDATDLYREDLSRAVRPRRPVGEAHATTQRPTVETRPTPLVLVTEQRIDEATDLRSDPALVRPRRISGADILGEDGDGDAEDLPPLSPAEAKNFAEFAERLGATDLSELLEAAAAYTAAVEGRPHFSRPQILSKVAYVADDDAYNREAGLRSFGMLLRQGKIQKVRRGQFIITDQSRFIEEARRATR